MVDGRHVPGRTISRIDRKRHERSAGKAPTNLSNHATTLVLLGSKSRIEQQKVIELCSEGVTFAASDPAYAGCNSDKALEGWEKEPRTVAKHAVS